MGIARIRLDALTASAWLAAAMLAAPAFSPAQEASSTPVVCNDGTTSPHGGRGACSGHGGINKAASASGGAASAAPAAAATAGAATATAPPTASAPKTVPPAQAAPGGGLVQVWVTTESKVYH